MKAVFISLEDPGELVRHRLRAIALEYNLDVSALEQNLRVFDGADVEATLVTEVNEFGSRKLRPTAMMNVLKEAVAGCDLIIIDNASDGFDGDENNRRHVRFFLRALAQMARQHNAGLVLLAHIDKNAAIHGANGNNYSGSTAWHNSARSRLALLTVHDSIALHHEKSNLSRPARPVALKWSEGWAGAGVLIPEHIDIASAQEAAAKQIKSDMAVVLKLVGLAGDSGISVASAMAGPSTSHHVLARFPEMPRDYKSKSGRARVYAALTQLRRDGNLIEAEIKAANRNKKGVLELTQAGRDELNRVRASNPHTPSATDARTWECSSVDTSSPTHATHATDAMAGLPIPPNAY